MPVVLYYVPASSPCRFVLLTAAALDVQLELRLVDFWAGEHLKPEYLKLNPQHTVPTAVDGDFSLGESRAIARYLVAKTGGSSLYPEDPKTRAQIDQIIDFDLTSLYATLTRYYFPVFTGDKLDEPQLEKLHQKLSILNSFLEGQKYAVGSQLTLADIALVTTVSGIESFDINLKTYPNIVRWYELVKSTAPGYEEINKKGLAEFKQMINSFRSKTKEQLSQSVKVG